MKQNGTSRFQNRNSAVGGKQGTQLCLRGWGRAEDEALPVAQSARWTSSAEQVHFHLDRI